MKKYKVNKAIILAGGTGSRLLPLTKVTNKHLLPIGKDPMIIHPIKKVVSAGIQDVMIVTGTEHMGDMVSLLGSGKDHGCRFTYKVQDTPDGIAGALNLCRDFVNGEPVLVILGDNIFEDNLSKMIKEFEIHKQVMCNRPAAMFMLKKVKDPQRFGVATIEETKITKIVEKPSNPESDFCVTGIYIYDAYVFEYVSQCGKSGRGEYEISDVNSLYVSSGGATFVECAGWWTDAGTHDSYQNANRLITKE